MEASLQKLIGGIGGAYFSLFGVISIRKTMNELRRSEGGSGGDERGRVGGTALFFVVGAAGWGEKGVGAAGLRFIYAHTLPPETPAVGLDILPPGGAAVGCDAGGTEAVIVADVDKFATAAGLGGRLYDPTAVPRGCRGKGQISKKF